MNEGLKSDSSAHCDELVSLPKAILTRYVGHLSQAGVDQLRSALIAALDLGEASDWL